MVEGRDPRSASEETQEEEKIHQDHDAEDLGAEPLAQVALLHENGVQPDSIQQIEEDDRNACHRHEAVVVGREDADHVDGDGPGDELPRELGQGGPSESDQNLGSNIVADDRPGVGGD